jgi:hypothetical protein
MVNVIPYGEWKPDISAYKGQHSPTITNAYPRGDGYGPVKAFAGLSDAMAGACRGFYSYFHTDGTIRIFSGTATELYLMSNSNFSWDTVSLATYTTLSTAHQWQFTSFRNRVIAVNPNDDPQSFVVGSSTDFDDLAGNPPNSSYVTTVGPFVVLSGITGDPFTIHWSSRADPAEWTAGTNEGDTQTFDSGGLVRGVAGGEFGIVFQDSAIRRMTYAPGSTVVFEFDQISDDMGLLAPYSIIRARDFVFFLSTNGFMKYHPAQGFTPIGRERVDRTFMDDCDLNNKQLIIGANDPTGTRVLWAYKSAQGTTGLFDRVVAYDYILDRWAGYVNLSGEYMATAAIPGLTLDNLDNINTSIDALPVSLDDYATGFAKHVALADSSHVIGLLSGANLEATLETPEIADGAKRLFFRGSRPITDCSTVYSSVMSKHRPSDAFTQGSETQMTAQGYAPHRVDTRVAKIKHRFPAGATWTHAIGAETDLTGTGER